MAQIKDENKKYYFSVSKPEERDEILKTLMEEQPEILLWQQGMSEKKVETYEIIKYDESQKTLKLKSKASLLAKLSKSSLVDKLIFVKMKHERYQYFTTTTLAFDPKENCYKIPIINDFYISQQRSDYRLHANRNNVMKIRIDGELFDCLDLSSGGTSFLVEEDQKDRFAKNSIFTECKIQFDQQVFEIPTMKVAAQFPKDSEEGKKMTGLGIQFVDMPPKVDEELCRMVHTEARAQEVRKTLLKKDS